jgi:hypothetical protein
MTEEIKQNISNPEKLEQLYREDRKSFESGFEEIFKEFEDNELAKYWKIRLEYDKSPEKVKRITGSDLFIMLAVCCIAGFLVRIPAIFNIKLSDFQFYEKDAGIIFFLGLTIYTLWTNRIVDKRKLFIIFAAVMIPVLYINLLPSDKTSNSINLAYIHLPLLMWCTYGLVYTDFNFKDKSKRIEFIKHNGDLAVLGAIILIAGGVVTGITVGLFNAINIHIEKFYMENVVVIGLVSVPVLATFILKNFALMTNKIARVIANIFSPVVLITLIIYLIAIVISKKDPFNDRDFLLIFNIMLLGVMGIIAFSVSETSLITRQKLNEMILFLLAVFTLIIDMIALSAILYRLVEYGITSNRLAVAGSNILIFGNLVLITIDLFKINFRKSAIEKVGLTISGYLPVYILWIVIVIFGFPLIFGLK